MKTYYSHCSFFPKLTVELFSIVGACFVVNISPCLAYDLSDPYAESLKSGGQGINQDGQLGVGNTSRSFEEYTGYTGASEDGLGRTVREAPISQQNITRDGQQIYEYNQSQAEAVSGNNGIKRGGTSFWQAPVGVRSLGQQTTTNLLSAGSPGGYTQIPGGKFNFGFETKGGAKGMSTPYRGLIYNTVPQLGGGSLSGTLPPASLGSVDINIVSRTRRITPAMLNGPTTLPR